MLKLPCNVVLDLAQSSTSLRHACGSALSAALLKDQFEHPVNSRHSAGWGKAWFTHHTAKSA